jgi:hypothetical protein
MSRAPRPSRVLLPPEIDAARRLVDVPVSTLAELAERSVPNVVNALAGRKPASQPLLAALVKIGLLDRAAARAEALLRALAGSRS